MPLQSDIGIATSAYSHLSLAAALDRIEELAAAAEITSYGAHTLLDIDNARAVMGRRLSFSVHGPFSNVSLGNLSESKRRAAVELHRRHLKIAALLGATVYVVHPDRKETLGPRSDLMAANLQRSFAELCVLQDSLGIPIAVENMPTMELSHYAAPGDLDLCGLGLALDTGHASLCGNLDAWLADPRAEVRHVHLHDNRGPGTGDQHAPLGTGVVDAAAVLEVAQAIGASVVLEHKNEADVLASLEYLKLRGLIG
ncbi:MAG TPA: sugar phosphate isomerase/epimerase family protein [Thermoleophilia bacterium]|nr:sugar phosphate isomerase/epimerase family protein [Thermoleophilia bacterium]